MSLAKERASQAEIMNRAAGLLGSDVVADVSTSTAAFAAEDVVQGFECLTRIDERFGPHGLHDIFPNSKHPGVFRPITYVFLVLRHPNRVDLARTIVVDSCGYVEAVVKRMARLNFFDQLLDGLNRLPMGAVVDKVQERLPPALYTELKWLSGRIYNYAKHERAVPVGPDGRAPDHYFALDEAIAIYLIARRLAADLMALSGKPLETFTEEKPW